MSNWVNHVTIAAPRNGTTAHICDPSNATGGGTVVTGSAFTPTSGRLLVVVCYGGVTFTTPSGWTLPASGSAINNGGLYVFTRTAAGSDTFTTTQNSSNYAVVFDVYEFNTGSTFVASLSATAVANGGAGPNLTGLTGTNWIAGCAGWDDGSTFTTAASHVWASGTEIVDTWTPIVTTDGYSYSLTEFNSDASTSKSVADTITVVGGTFTNFERLVFAVNAVTGTNANVVLGPSRQDVVFA